MNKKLRFKNKKIAVIGAGVEGLLSAKWLKEHGALITVLDQKDGKDYLKNLDKYDLIVRSPGVKLSTIREAFRQGSKVEITSQTKLFFDFCPCPIIGVTGTKGKGTTASLIYEMLKKEGYNAYLGGNIGQPPLEFLDKLSTQAIVVLELSSFQLQDLTKSPHIAVFLMTTSEHLDYHEDINEYVSAKRNLLRFQTASDFAILNKDYPASRESDTEIKGKVFWVSREGIAEGCFVRGKKIIVRGAEVAHKNFLVPHSQTARHANSENFVGSSRTKDIEIIGIKDILLPGAHNLENVRAAVMAAFLAGVSKQNIVSVLKTFKGLEHRLELVREVGGV
ncbi:UDP-N-acetylmuramoyl-L-alanine--D-glutamate ligase, partial [Candidatus Microgenomates bacterium]|nr:UDP-N-acetylmuramoyl-L-alanine--D-glutamate ligase [Candidatus Microgenomates bacterium]